MHNPVIEVFAAGGVGACLLTIIVIVRYFLKKYQLPKQEQQTKNENNINITPQKEEGSNVLKELIYANRDSIEKAKEELDEINLKIERLSLAMILYVKSNGVDETIKNEFENIIKGVTSEKNNK
ncbi:hypothetical protein [Mycoplasmopsis cynos]|uniref:Uncharacterized protein n=1 Tax=Mycoplasmopsis cynos TaxID=171284 RepID=A0A449AHZ6_9BACT|nr:hypothetical protein [Mycoplasmopsis cynos]TQC54609.1 hypothetical protein E1I74_02345 [Mycoplasmopsis cynos]WQQ13444.1 hypothetical protein RRG58_01715 [Mycoplasmopsis cynos]WQQ13719.1 hypothetical protein RRG52_03125 [Mycoplasmopsis cynos]WQQ16857.1 hypothetical protein RRG39_03740 [Mycoplasmopsis cynos]VEU64420.1 Uncharacterised protein [Mycoplasmopsis cynos]